LTGKKYYLYRHIRLDKSEPFYIGIGTEISRRAWEFRRRNQFWKNIVNKNNGLYDVELLCRNLTKEEAERKEIEFITLYGRKINNTGSLCNIQPGGKLHTGYKLSEQQKLHLSLLHPNSKNSRLRKASPEERERILMGRKGRIGANKGTIWSKEVREKMSKGHLGNSSHTGKIWINNGINCTLIEKGKILPNGYIPGRISFKNKSILKIQYNKN
jgi:hypothetical protein